MIHGLNRHYYSIAINYRKTELEERMLLNLQVGAGRLGVPVAEPLTSICHAVPYRYQAFMVNAALGQHDG